MPLFLLSLAQVYTGCSVLFYFFKFPKYMYAPPLFFHVIVLYMAFCFSLSEVATVFMDDRVVGSSYLQKFVHLLLDLAECVPQGRTHVSH